MLKQIKKNFFDIRPHEWPRALLLSLFFFLVIAVFWVLKPIKKSALISFYRVQEFQLLGMEFGGAEAEQLAKVLNMLVVYAMVVLITVMINKLKRQQVIYFFCGIIAVLLVYFALVMSNPGAFQVWSFYVFGDIFNSIMVGLFWAFSNDVNKPGQSKRLYGIVGLGGVLGGAFGAQFVRTYVTQEGVGRQGLILGCVLAIAIIAAIVYLVNKEADKDEDPSAREPDEDRSSAAIEGAKIVFSSKYLLSIMAIIGLYEIVSNIVEFQFSATVESSEMSGTEIDAFFGLWGWTISGISILAQLFLTPFLMNRKSIGAALLVLPVMDLILSGGFLIMPGLYVVMLLSASDNGFNYSINQSAKESLYTPTSRDVKYKAKAFIDMFVQRFAKVLAVVLNLIFAAYVGIQGVQWLAIASIGVLVFWIYIVKFVDDQFKKKSAENS